MYSKWMLLLYSCYKSMIHPVHIIIYRCMLQLLLIGDASQDIIEQWCITAIIKMIHDTCYGSLLYRIDLWCALYTLLINYECYTCHQLMHATHVTIFVAISINVLFLCYDFYVLVYFGSLRYVTYIIDQIFDK